MKEFKFKFVETQRLCEDIGVMIHRSVCQIMLAGRGTPMSDIAFKAKLPLKTLQEIYYGRRSSATAGQIGRIQWACEEVLKAAKGKA